MHHHQDIPFNKFENVSIMSTGKIIHAIYGMLHERRQSAAASCNSTGSFYELTGLINIYTYEYGFYCFQHKYSTYYIFPSNFLIQYRKCIFILHKIYILRSNCLFSSNNGIANKKKFSFSPLNAFYKKHHIKKTLIIIRTCGISHQPQEFKRAKYEL